MGLIQQVVQSTYITYAKVKWDMDPSSEYYAP